MPRASPCKTKPQVFGVSHDYQQAANLHLSEGRFFSAAEQESHAQVCVIGSKVRQDLFDDAGCRVAVDREDLRSAGHAGRRGSGCSPHAATAV